MNVGENNYLTNYLHLEFNTDDIAPFSDQEVIRKLDDDTINKYRDILNNINL